MCPHLGPLRRQRRVSTGFELRRLGLERLGLGEKACLLVGLRLGIRGRLRISGCLGISGCLRFGCRLGLCGRLLLRVLRGLAVGRGALLLDRTLLLSRNLLDGGLLDGGLTAGTVMTRGAGLFTTTGALGDEVSSDGMLISDGMLKTVLGVLCAAVFSTFEFFMPSMSAKAPMPMASSASAPAAIFMPESDFWGATGIGAY